MGLWARTGRYWRAGALVGVGLAGGGAALAVASVPDSNGVIHACYSVDGNGNPVTTSGPNLTVIDPSAGQSCNTTRSPTGAPATQHALNWNVSGPAGPQGPPGAQGPGGQTATIVQGQTLTLPGGQVIGVGGSGGGPAAPPTGGVVGGIVLGSGAQALSFDIRGFSLATSQGGGSGGSGSGGGAGKVSVHDISITKHVDKASPKLFLACATGQHIKKGTITMRKAGKPYLVITLTDVLISSVQTSSHGSQQPAETISLNFTKIQFQYFSKKGTFTTPPVNLLHP